MDHSPLDILQSVVDESPCWTEMRFHDKKNQSITVERGRIEQAVSLRRMGVGIRVLEKGAFGFSSTNILNKKALKKALESARIAAQTAAQRRKDKIHSLPAANMARGIYEERDIPELLARPLEDKVRLALRIEKQTRESQKGIQTATCRYTEVFEEKAIVTSDGASVVTRLIRPEFQIQAVAGAGSNMAWGVEGMGVTGGWQCLFKHLSAEQLAERAARRATELVHAELPSGGPARVILSPALVGLLAHEAIGHTVEADFVAAGSVAAGKMGHRVASDLVTLSDSGSSELSSGAGGTLTIDDEGIPTQNVTIIKNGILNSYLHNRETAALEGVPPTGNARAWGYSDEPLVRMRNTYISPGEQNLDEMISEIKDGYLLEGAEGGQADSNGEFMFGVQEARRIRGGKLAELVRGVTISGIAFEVLKTVDAVSTDFRWDLGTGYCGKGQPAKVDAGGPYVRCWVTLGGKIS